MTVLVYFVPGQTEERRKVFLEWENHSLWGGGGNVNCYKSFHDPIPTRGNREHPGNFQNK